MNDHAESPAEAPLVPSAESSPTEVLPPKAPSAFGHKERQLRQRLAVGAVLTLGGIVGALLLPPPIGGVVLVVGVLLLAISIDRLGRLGAD